MISPFILKCQGELLQTKVEYCTKIIHKSKIYFAIVGSERVYLFSDSFDQIFALIDYKHIERVIVSTKDPSLFQMHMNERKNVNVPNKMNIHTLNRRHLVHYIAYAWKTDYLYNNLESRDMPLYTKDFQDNGNETSMLKGPLLALMVPQPSQQFTEFILDGYKFWMPSKFTPAEEKGIYKHSEDKTCFINIQVAEQQPLEVLHLIGDRNNLQFYCEQFAELLVIQELAEAQQADGKNDMEGEAGDEVQAEDDELKEEEEVIPEGSDRVNDYWIMYSGPYIKRENIVNDPAEWSGWEVDLRTKQRDFIVIFMRRKYIPPMMENYEDFVISFYGPIGKTTLITEEKKVNEEEEEDEEEKKQDQDEDEDEDDDESGDGAKKVNDGKLLLDAYDLIVKGQEFQILIRDIADTFQSIYNVVDIYQPLIQTYINALMPDAKTMKFYQTRQYGVPKYIAYGICLLYWIFDTVLEQIRIILIIDLLAADEGYYKSLKAQLKQEYSKEIKENSDLMQLYDPKLESPFALVRKFLSKNYSDLSQKPLEGDRKTIWTYKLSRYLTFCLNGGLMGSQFNLKQYFKIIDNTTGKYRESLTKLLDFLLHAAPESSGAGAVYTEMDLLNRIQKLVGQKYVYNEKIMTALLKYDYLSQYYLKDNSPQLYTELMIYILMNARNSKLKMAVCKHIIKFQHQSKDQMNEVVLNSFKPLVSPLLFAFQNPNKVLSTLACVALFNMCASSREFKYLIVKEDGARILIAALQSKDANQLTYALKLIHNLLSIVQHVEKFLSMKIIDLMFNIIAGIDIRDAHYSAQSLVCVCQILKVCITNDYKFRSINAVINLLINLYVEDSKKYFVNERIFIQLQLETLNVIGKLCLLNPEIKNIVNEALIFHVLEAVVTVKNGSSAEIERIEKLIFFLCIMIQNNREYREEWKSKQPLLVDAISCYEKQSMANAAYLMKELTFEEDKKKKTQDN